MIVSGPRRAQPLRLLARLDAWFLAPAPPGRLAVFRILTGMFAVIYLLVRSPVLLDMGDRTRSELEPVGLLWWMTRPLAPGEVRALVVGTIVLGVAYTVGAGFRVVGPTFAAALLALTTYRSSGGQILWFDDLLVLHVVIVGCSSAADALALRRRTVTNGADPARYGWPLRLAATVTVASYVLAGVAKLRIGGTAWVDGESLRNHVAYSAARLRVLGGTPSPLASALMGQVWLFTLLAIATLLIELGAPIALFGRRWCVPWVIAMWSLHAGIAATMFVVFPYPLSFVAFAPLFKLERLPLLWTGARQRRGSSLHRGGSDRGRAREG